jgi:hypothetical protein
MSTSSSMLTTNQRIARKKGITAAVVGGAGLALLAVLNAPVLGIVGLVGGGYLTYDWFMFRAKRGMRF